MGRKVVMKDVPSEDLQEVKADFESEGATVEHVLQSDGKFTVTATFPNGEESGEES